MALTITRTGRTIQASESNAGNATKTSAAYSMDGKVSIFLIATITNGGTGPSKPCSVTIEASTNGTDGWKKIYEGISSNAGGATTEFPFQVPSDIMYIRSVFKGNDDQNVTVECVGHETTSIA